jgi:diguanylate cyclase (GGDEF)-like protein/PAS domain S-box-containing protein
VITQSPAFHRALKRLSVLYRAGFAAIAILAVVAYVFTARAIHRERQHIQSGHQSSGPTIEELGRLEAIARVTTATILLTLLVESMFVFRPALRRLQRERDAVDRTAAGRERALAAARAAEARLAESEMRFRSSFDSAAIGMALVSLDGRLLDVNRSLCTMLGYPPDELKDSDIAALTHPDDREESAAELARLASGEVPTLQFQKRYLRRDGRIVWAVVNAGLVRDMEGRPLSAVVHMEDVTARKRAEEELARYQAELRTLALSDELTGVHNRRGFRAIAEQLCRAQSRSDQPLAMVAVDVDNLKMINDRWGHEAGDRAIVLVATALTSTFRTSDLIGRMGGDEFLVLLARWNETDVQHVRARFAAQLTKLALHVPEEFPLGASLGMAVAPAYVAADLDGLVREADQSLYDAKRARIKAEDTTTTPRLSLGPQ